MAATQTQNATLSGRIGNLIKLLPTGTVFIYQLISPVATNNGHCHTANKIVSSVLIALSGLFCIVVTFTDSYTGADKKTHYAFVTRKGLWPAPTDEAILSKVVDYKLNSGDFVHAFLSVVVFAMVVLFDRNALDCFFPTSMEPQKLLFKLLPTAVGFVSSVGLAVSIPNRNWFGYPSKPQDQSVTVNDVKSVA